MGFFLALPEVLLVLWESTKLGNSGKLKAGQEEHANVRRGMKSRYPLVQIPQPLGTESKGKLQSCVY